MCVVLTTLSQWDGKERVRSKMTPRFLNSGTSVMVSGDETGGNLWGRIHGCVTCGRWCLLDSIDFGLEGGDCRSRLWSQET